MSALTKLCPFCDTLQLESVIAEGDGAVPLDGSKPVKHGDRIHICRQCGTVATNNGRPAANKRASAKRGSTTKRRPATKRASTKRASTKRASTKRASTKRASTKRAARPFVVTGTAPITTSTSSSTARWRGV